jgi:hypothetical protein
MNLLLRLYPRAWRERYGDELVALLAERPASMLDNLDLIRGALDARLHPQLQGSSSAPQTEVSGHHRQLGPAAALGGVAWILAIASLFVLPRDVYGERDASLAAFGLAVGSILISVALGELGSRAGSATSTKTGHIASYASFFVGATLALGWPLFIIGFYGFPVVAWLLVVRGSRNQALPQWLIPVFGVGALAMIAGGLGGVAAEVDVLLIGVPGLVALILAWLAFNQRPSAGPTMHAA